MVRVLIIFSLWSLQRFSAAQLRRFHASACNSWIFNGYVDCAGAIQTQKDRPQEQGGCEGANQDSDLLIARRRANEKAGFQVLRRGTAIRRCDTNDGAYRKCGH